MNISKMSIAEIKELLTAATITEDLLEMFAQDHRSGVRNLLLSYRRRQAAIEKEHERIKLMMKYEKELWSGGYALIAGIDEAGRGPLAGPVVAAAVVLPKDVVVEGLNDSKKLSHAQRAELEMQIRHKALAVAIGIVTHHEIDEINIYQASLRAMRQAVLNLKVQPEYLLVDAVKIPEISIPQKPIIHGDALSSSIAAASIIAKETRDRIMLEYDKKYPVYGFARHKGYGTPEHLEALRNHGPSPIHRMTFGLVRQDNT